MCRVRLGMGTLTSGQHTQRDQCHHNWITQRAQSVSHVAPTITLVMFKSIFNSKYCLGSFTKKNSNWWCGFNKATMTWAQMTFLEQVIRGWTLIPMKIWFVFCITWNHSNFTVSSCICTLFRLTLVENYIENKMNFLLFWFDLRSVTSWPPF